LKRLLAVLTILTLLFGHGAFGKVQVEAEKEEKIYLRGLQQFKTGSYSTALNYFLELLKPGSKYYKEALLMLSKTYFAIGRKTGMKKYLWQALNYLQLYFIELGQNELPWDYYYTKGRIYEALSFYEQALAVYRVAFLRAKTQKEKVKTTIGIIRSAVWIRRPDIAEEYFILISTGSQKLSKEEEKELTFVKGLFLFSQGKYREALPYFFKLYKEYEEYLIENPNYYLLVAENLYRLGKLTLAEQLFIRIASLTRDREVVRRATLRLGDIELKRGNRKLAFIYYYSVIRDYPSSEEATVARLKIIPLLKYPEIKYRAQLTKEKAFREPIRYIAQVLVNYRTTYTGIYALADLGYLVFRLDSPESVFERLTWELSLVFPEEVKYEQREFIKYLWKPYLLKLPHEKSCKLYRANPRFFQEVFSKEVLLKLAYDLKKCNMRELRLKLLNYMVKKWKGEQEKLLMAQALFETRDFEDSLKILKEIKNKDSCSYQILLGELSIFLPNLKLNLQKLQKSCKGKEKVKVASITIYYLSEIGKIESAFTIFEKFKENLIKKYGKELVVKAALEKLLEEATLEDKYRVTYQLSRALFDSGYKNCLIGSYLAIASLRLGKEEESRKTLKEIEGCIDPLSKLAKTIYQDTLLIKEIKNGTLQGVKAD
jgi:tetratricopeptide (TPR) repeat protein